MERIIRVIIIVFFLSSCSTVAISSEGEKRKYGVLLSAVTFASDKVIGYYEEIPETWDAKAFLAFLKNKIPDDYNEALAARTLVIYPRKTYYLLIVQDKKNAPIVFDYSCTPEADGPVLNDPGKYNLDHLEKYDTCKTQE